MNKIILKKGKQESLLRKHPWIFSGAIASASENLEEGELVDVFSSTGDFLARGHCQIGSIAVRVLSFEQQEINLEWWCDCFKRAYRLRQCEGLVDSQSTNCYRLIHGEGDSLPGLVVDIYDRVAVVQCHSVGMYLSREMIAAAIKETYGQKIDAIYDKSSSTLPFNAGLDAVDEYIYGLAAEKNTVLENSHKFYVNWQKGQKTGFFLDQRVNRELVAHYAKGRTVLNTFCYTGGFSIYALGAGALSVDSVDSSAKATELASENVELNFGANAAHNSVCQDAFEFMKSAQYKYDMIILDPPAFAKHHKVLGNALQGYRRLNIAALERIAPGGILFTFSCSQAVSKEQFRTMVFSSAAIAGRRVRILHQLTQPADHPISIYHPEGEYLKGLVLYVE